MWQQASFPNLNRRVLAQFHSTVVESGRSGTRENSPERPNSYESGYTCGLCEGACPGFVTQSVTARWMTYDT